jgi:hypothetical protein
VWCAARPISKIKHASAAAAEFQKILDQRGLAAKGPIYPLARLGLARRLRSFGEKDKSRTRYQDFLALWKDVDADIPVLKQTKAEIPSVYQVGGGGLCGSWDPTSLGPSH